MSPCGRYTRGCAIQVFLSVLLAISAGCGGGTKKEIPIAGSNSAQPFVEMLAEEFMSRNPGVRIVVQGAGSTTGIVAVREGAAAIGTVSRPLFDEEKDLKATTFARDGIVVVVHPSNPVSGLTTEQTRDIFAGRIKDWAKLGGNSGEIQPVMREKGSGTYGAFEELVMKGEKIASQVMVQQTNGGVREAVANAPRGIGFMSQGVVNASVRALRVDGVEAGPENIRNGSYPLARPFLFVTKEEPAGVVKQFVDFVLSEESQRLLEEEGLVGVK